MYLKNNFILVVTLALLSISLKAASENLINVSWGDNIMIGSGLGQLDTPEKIRDSLAIWNDYYNGKTILWRISSEYIDRFYERRGTSNFAKAYNAKVDSIKAKFDPAKIVREETRKNGQNLLLYATFLDHGAPITDLYAGDAPFPWQDKVTIAHPEYQERDLNGNYHYGVLDLANPDARKFIIKRLVDFVKEYDADGLYLCSRTHSVPPEHADQFGFGPQIVAEYQKRYGIDITKDPRFDWKNGQFAPHSPEVEAWRKLRGEYLVTFMKELRAALSGKILYLGLPRGNYQGAPFGNMYIDTEKIISDKLADGIVLNVFTGRGLYPLDKKPHRERGYLCSYDDNFNVPSKKEALDKLAPLCRKNGVKLFYSGIGNSPSLDGVMMGAPNARPTLQIADNPIFSDGPLTIDGWFMLPANQENSTAPRLISKYSHNGSSERGWEISLNPQGLLEFRTNLLLPGQKQSDMILASNRKPPRDKWVHIAAVFDPSKNEKRLYVDGQLCGTQKIPAGAKLNPNRGVNILLGVYSGSGVQEAQMMVDELRICTVPQVFTKVPQTPYSGKEPGTLVLLHFDSPEKKADTLAPGLKLDFIGTPPIVPGHFGGCMNMRD